MCSVRKQKAVTENMAHILWTKWFDSFVSVPIGSSFWLRKGLAAYYVYKITEEVTFCARIPTIAIAFFLLNNEDFRIIDRSRLESIAYTRF